MALERIVKRFYDELENGKVMGRKCHRCGAVEFPPVLACNTCSCFDMDWIEMSGEGVVEELIKPSLMNTTPENESLKPYCFGIVKLKEGPEYNAIIRGVDPAKKYELRAKLPLPVKMSIIQRDGYKTVIYDLVEE